MDTRVARRGLRARLCVIALMSAVAAGAGATGKSGARLDSGIEGHIEIGPVRSVERLGAPNTVPYQATVTVLGGRGNTVTTVTSDAQGNFRVGLPPGTYTLRPESAARYPRASPQSVVVTPGTFTAVRIVYDSGRR